MLSILLAASGRAVRVTVLRSYGRPGWSEDHEDNIQLHFCMFANAYHARLKLTADECYDISSHFVAQ
jgi:hypothetical protein